MGIADQLQRYVAKEQERTPKTSASMSVLFSFFFCFSFGCRGQGALCKKGRAPWLILPLIFVIFFKVYAIVRWAGFRVGRNKLEKL